MVYSEYPYREHPAERVRNVSWAVGNLPLIRVRDPVDSKFLYWDVPTQQLEQVNDISTTTEAWSQVQLQVFSTDHAGTYQPATLQEMMDTRIVGKTSGAEMVLRDVADTLLQDIGTQVIYAGGSTWTSPGSSRTYYQQHPGANISDFITIVIQSFTWSANTGAPVSGVLPGPPAFIDLEPCEVHYP